MRNKFLFILCLVFVVQFNNLFSTVNKIFIELDNVVFNINEDVVKGVSFLKNVSDGYRNELFECLEDCDLDLGNVDLSGIEIPIFYKGHRLPKLVALYFLGSLNSKKAKSIAQEAVNKKYAWYQKIKKTALSIAADTLFTPEKTVQILEPNNQFINFISSNLVGSNNELYLVTNKPNKTIELLRKKYPDIFKMFNGGCINSQQLKKLKPGKEFFQSIVGNNFKNCFAIESEPRYTVATRDLGINSVLYNSESSLKNIKNQFNFKN